MLTIKIPCVVESDFAKEQQREIVISLSDVIDNDMVHEQIDDVIMKVASAIEDLIEGPDPDSTR
jgi:hypothetical protein